MASRSPVRGHAKSIAIRGGHSRWVRIPVHLDRYCARYRAGRSNHPRRWPARSMPLGADEQDQPRGPFKVCSLNVVWQSRSHTELSPNANPALYRLLLARRRTTLNQRVAWNFDEGPISLVLERSCLGPTNGFSARSGDDATTQEVIRGRSFRLQYPSSACSSPCDDCRPCPVGFGLPTILTKVALDFLPLTARRVRIECNLVRCV